MFEIKTNLRTLLVEAAGYLSAMRMGIALAIPGEVIESVNPAGAFPFIIVEIKA